MGQEADIGQRKDECARASNTKDLDTWNKGEREEKHASSPRPPRTGKELDMGTEDKMYEGAS